MAYDVFRWFRNLVHGIRTGFNGARDCAGSRLPADSLLLSAAEGSAAALWLRDSPYRYKRVVYRKEDHIRVNDELEEDAERAVRQRVVNEMD